MSSEPQDNREERWPAEFSGAVRRHDPAAVIRLAQEAGDRNLASAVRPLCELLHPELTAYYTPPGQRKGWREARAKAAWALKEIGDSNAIGALMHVVGTTSDFVLREAALASVTQFGPEAIPASQSVLLHSRQLTYSGACAIVHHIGSLSSLNEGQRNAAAQVCVDVLSGKLAAMRTRHRSAGWSYCFTVLITNGPWWLLLFLSNSRLSPIAFAVLCTTAALIVGGRQLAAAARTRGSDGGAEVFALAADGLIALKSKPMLPALIKIAFGPNRISRCGRQARYVLTKLLPDVAPVDIALFDSQDILLLNAALWRREQPELCMAILCVLELSGNDYSIVAAERVAKQGSTQEVRTRAAQAAEIIRSRVAQQRTAQSLLRASTAPVTPPEEMLRAATASAAEPSEQLLRPVNP